MYSDRFSVLEVNEHFLESFNIALSVCQGCPISSLLYVLALERLELTLEVSGEIVCELGCGRFVSAYVGDLTSILSVTSEIEMINNTASKYETFT